MVVVSFRSLALILGLALIVSVAAAFTAPGTTTTSTARPFKSSSSSWASSWASSSSRLQASQFDITDAMSLAEKMETGRALFYFWFFGASGASAIGRRAIPEFFRKESEKLSLNGVGPTLGGEKLGLNPLCFYPEDLCRADVAQLVSNTASVDDIVLQYPIENNFLSAKGYLVYDAYKRANEGCNPLTIRAVFDTLNCNSDMVEPDKAQDRLDQYRTDMDQVKTELLIASLRRYFAIGGLIGLLFLADYEAFVLHMIAGWFPEWPGLSDFPSSLFDPETGLTSLTKYYMWDIPS